MEPRPETPVPNLFTMFVLRSSSLDHGGIYGPADPRTCESPNGPCEYCQDRISAAETLVALSRSCAEVCPECNAIGSFVTHADKGYRCCNGCQDRLCIRCFFGARYYCPLRKMCHLSPPTSPLTRQEALGVQSPKAQEKGENK
jgi:hypothetical protein